MKPTQLISGTFKQQNAAIYLGLGFMPDYFRLYNASDGEDMILDWNINMRVLAAIEGYAQVGDDDEAFDVHDLAFGEGAAIYRGGAAIGSGTTPSTTTYLAKEENPDKRASGTGDDIDTWTLQNSSNRTGKWNAVCSTTYVGIGSRICVDGKWATVVAISSNGADDNEVTLNEALKSGTIQYLTNMYDWVAQASGTITKAGIIISDTTYLLDAATDMMVFEAGTYR